MTVETLDVRNAIKLSASKDPRVIIFAGEHGDEHAGVRAIERLLFDFVCGVRTLRKGSVILVRANEQALAANRRYLHYNLNRLYKDEYTEEFDHHDYEYDRAQILKGLLKQCDYYISLHTVPVGSEPFLFVEKSCVETYRPMNIGKLVVSWSAHQDSPVGGDSENYANGWGAKSCTLEAGSHDDPKAADIAYESVLRMFERWGMVDVALPSKAVTPEVYEIYEVILKRNAGFVYEFRDAQGHTLAPRNFQFVPQGFEYGFDGKTGSAYVAPEDSYLLIPDKDPDAKKVGEEVGYLARKIGL